jgi:hypothetical protein
VALLGPQSSALREAVASRNSFPTLDWGLSRHSNPVNSDSRHDFSRIKPILVTLSTGMPLAMHPVREIGDRINEDDHRDKGKGCRGADCRR